MKIRRTLMPAALSLALAASLIAQPALAAGAARTVNDPLHSGFGVSCQAGDCVLQLDLGEIEFDMPVLTSAPVKFDVPQDKVPFLPGGAGIEISDKIELRLPFGKIQIDEGDFVVRVDEVGKLVSFHGASPSIMPTFSFANNMRIVKPFAAEFGYDYGDTLGELSPLLDADQRYVFIRLGSGFTVDTVAPDGDGVEQPLTFTVPQGETATLVIDPEQSLVYFDGQVSLLQVAQVGAIAAGFGLGGGQLPMLDGLILPMETTVGLTTLLSRDPQRNFVEVSGGMAVNGGLLGQLLKLEHEPLAIDVTARIDYSGLLLQGVAESSIMPETVLNGGGVVELFVPFSSDLGAYVRIGGELAVPLAGIDVAGSTQLGGAVAEGGGAPWWEQVDAWAGDTAAAIAAGAQTGIAAVQEGAAGGRTAVIEGASTAWTMAGDRAAVAIDKTTVTAACALEETQNLWCQATGLCEVTNAVCGDASETASK